jgi:hypothetical protein
MALTTACRTPEKLVPEFAGEVRAGDLLDMVYHSQVFEGIDFICHTGTWGSLWAHENMEKTQFYEPTCDLIEQAIRCGVRRFLQTSTMVIAPPGRRLRTISQKGTVGVGLTAQAVYLIVKGYAAGLGHRNRAPRFTAHLRPARSPRPLPP